MAIARLKLAEELETAAPTLKPPDKEQAVEDDRELVAALTTAIEVFYTEPLEVQVGRSFKALRHDVGLRKGKKNGRENERNAITRGRKQ